MNSNIIVLIIFGSVEFCKNLPGRPNFSFDVSVDLPLPLRLEIDPGLQGGGVLLFGGFWQLERNVIYTQMFCTHLSESEAGSQIPRDGWIEGRFLANQCTSLWESKPIHQSLSCERKLFAKEADSNFQQ